MPLVMDKTKRGALVSEEIALVNGIYVQNKDYQY